MTRFIKCPIENIRYRQDTIDNNPVNIELCKSILKSRLAYYPDNTGKPTIKFKGCDTEWVFNNDESRNKEFEKILTKFN